LDSDFSKKIHSFSVRQDASAPSKAEGAPVAACASNRKPDSPIDNRQDSRAALRHLDVARKPAPILTSARQEAMSGCAAMAAP
jgi:hypothetical protein